MPKRRPSSWQHSFPKTGCPYCASTHTKVYTSRAKPVRYHQCLDCGRTFKSVEKLVKGELLPV